MKVKSESEVTQSCLTLSDPMDCSHQAPPSTGFAPALEWAAIAFSDDHPNGCEVVSYYVVMCISVVRRNVERHSTCLLALCVSDLWKCPFKSPWPNF